MSDFDILFAKIKSGNNLGIRTRQPKACLLCSSPKALNEYEACYLNSGNFVIDDVKKIKNLTIMDKKGKLAWRCSNCGAERVNDKYQNIPVYWVTCGDCSSKSLSLIEDKCPKCDPIAKKELEDFEAS